MTPERILHIVGRMNRAGAETMIMNLYREIDRERYQFDFVYFAEERCDYDDEIEALGGRIYRIPSRSAPSRFVALWRLLRKGQWKTVHSHTLFSSGLHLLAARLAGVPHRVAHSHSTQDANSKSLSGRAYQRISRVLLDRVPTSYVACGTAAARYLFRRRQDVQVIPNAIDIDKFAGASGQRVRNELGLDDRCLVVLQVGRLMPVKNHTRSVEIAAAMREADLDFRMLLVGSGPDEARIKALIEAHSLQDRVLLLGMREDIPDLMSAADVMLMPSLHEGFPVVLVESQAAGLPAVVSSTVSREVDLGLELVSFLELEAPSDRWVQELRHAAQQELPDIAARRRVLEQKGFSAAAGARLLASVYSGL